MNSTSATVQSTTDTPLLASFSALVSSTYFILFVASLALYTLVFVAMARNRKDFTSPYYKYIASLAIGEFFNISYFGLFGALCTALTYCPVSMFVNTLISGLAVPGWPIEVATDVAIAFDRFVAVCFYSRYTTMSAGKLPFVIIAVTWLYAAVYAFPSCSLLVPLFCEPSTVMTSSNDDAVATVGYVQMCADAVTLSISAVLYAITFGAMWKRRKQNLIGNSAAMRRRERTLVVQKRHCGTVLTTTIPMNATPTVVQGEMAIHARVGGQ